jgi:2-phosphinomethylmalic acid synthase
LQAWFSEETLEVSLTKDSGLAGLVFVIRQRLGLDVAKDDPRLLEVYAWLTTEFDNGRQTSVEWEELEPVVMRAFSPTPTPDGDLARI